MPNSQTYTQNFVAAMQSLLSEIDAIKIPQDDPAALTGDLQQNMALFDLRVRQAQANLTKLEMKSIVLRDQLIQNLNQARHEERQTPDPVSQLAILLHCATDLTGSTSVEATTKVLRARYMSVEALRKELKI